MDNWYIGRNGQRLGPHSAAQLRQMAVTGGLKPTDLVWKEGMTNWLAASTIKGLFVGAPPSAGSVPVAMPLPTDLQLTAGPPSAVGPLPYADFLPRVGASMLDGLFVSLMACIPAVCISALIVLVVGQQGGSDQDVAALTSAAGQCVSGLLQILIGMAYYVILEISPKQGTWGKQIVGIKVTDLEGNRITVGRALSRYLAKVVSGCTLGIGMLMPLFTEKKQTLHDMITGCLALKK